MKQYIKFLKFLWVILIVPTLYGTTDKPQFGIRQKMPSDSVQFVEVVKKALGVNDINSRKEAITVIREVFQDFINEKQSSGEGRTNVLFWNGNAYLNGSIPIAYNFSNLRLKSKNKDYQPLQLYEIFDFKFKEMYATKKIYERFPLLESMIDANVNKKRDQRSRFLQRSKKRDTLLKFWNEARKNSDSKSVNKILKKYSYKDHNYLKPAADYLISANSLGSDTKNVDLNREGLLKFYNEAEKKTKEFLEEFRKYICVLNPGAEKSFSSDLEKVDSYLKEAPDLCDKYKKYTDTERIVQYLRKKDNTQSEPLYMISFLDACADCEKEIAENTNEKAITILISVCPFKDSRTRERPEDQTNQNFIQIQLP